MNTADYRTTVDSQALRQREINLNYWRNRTAPAAILAPIWTARGPIDRGGRARALVIHPQNPQILWAAAGSGGLWKSENGGNTWRPLADQLGLPAGSLAIDPHDPDVLFFGTGERFHSGGPGAGVYITRDGGDSWQRLNSTRLWRYVPSIAISPANSNVVLAAVADPDFPTRSGVYRTTNAGDMETRGHGTYITPSSIAFQPGSGTRVLGSFPDMETRGHGNQHHAFFHRLSAGQRHACTARVPHRFLSNRRSDRHDFRQRRHYLAAFERRR